jgi:hypothetical protein
VQIEIPFLGDVANDIDGFLAAIVDERIGLR